jgi:hypothetical protein
MDKSRKMQLKLCVFNRGRPFPIEGKAGNQSIRKQFKQENKEEFKP